MQQIEKCERNGSTITKNKYKNLTLSNAKNSIAINLYKSTRSSWEVNGAILLVILLIPSLGSKWVGTWFTLWKMWETISQSIERLCTICLRMIYVVQGPPPLLMQYMVTDESIPNQISGNPSRWASNSCYITWKQYV